MKLWYLLHGLVRGEHAVYVTHGEPDEVRKIMVAKGIEVDYYEGEMKMLHIRKVADPSLNPKGIEEGMREMYNKIFDGVAKPCRVVGSSVSETATEEQMKVNLEVESGFEGKPMHNKSPYWISRTSKVQSFALTRSAIA